MNCFNVGFIFVSLYFTITYFCCKGLWYSEGAPSLCQQSCIHLLPIKAPLLLCFKALEMSTLLRHVYCFHSQGKLENEFLWAEVEHVHQGHKWGRCACVWVRGSVGWGEVAVVKDEWVGMPKCAHSLADHFHWDSWIVGIEETWWLCHLPLLATASHPDMRILSEDPNIRHINSRKLRPLQKSNTQFFLQNVDVQVNELGNFCLHKLH